MVAALSTLACERKFGESGNEVEKEAGVYF